MPGPWDKYAAQSPQAGAGPWAKYAAPTKQSQYAAGSIAPPLRSYEDATAYGLSELGGGLRDVAKGAWGMIQPPSLNEAIQAGGNPIEMLVRRGMQGLGSLAGQATQIPGAIRDLAQSPDPLGALALTAPRAAGQGAGQALLAAATQAPAGRIVKAAGGALRGGAESLPIVGPVGKGMIRGGLKSWRASAPDIEIPASKVSSTPPESVSKSTQLQQARALQNIPTSQTAPTQASAQPAQVAPTSSNFPTPESRAASDLAFQMRYPKGIVPGRPLDPLAQKAFDESAGFRQPEAAGKDIGDVARQKNPEPPRAKSDVLTRLRAEAQKIPAETSSEPSGPQTLIGGKPVPADTNLAPALEKSLPQSRIQGKIMQFLRKEGSADSIERLMESPMLKGISRENVESAVKSLQDSRKIFLGDKIALRSR